MKKLTVKEQNFAELCVSLGNQTEAYRQAYDVSNKNAEWLKSKASHLAKKLRDHLPIQGNEDTQSLKDLLFLDLCLESYAR